MRLLDEVLNDPVWEDGELEGFCREYFERSEAEMRMIVSDRPDALKVVTVIEKPVDEEEDKLPKKPLSAAERARLYRERKKQEQEGRK